MRSFCLLTLFLLAFAWPQAEATTTALMPAHLEIAISYVGITETAPNSGPAIDDFLRHVGHRPGAPWCAAFVSHTLSAAGAQAPATRTALASRFIDRTSIDAKHVLRGTYDPSPGDIVVWRRGDTVFGHVGLLVSSSRSALRTVEGNTGPEGGGPDGVWERWRTISPGNHFRITHFTPVSYAARR